MKKGIAPFFSFFLTTSLFMSSFGFVIAQNSNKEEIQGRKIVVFKDYVTNTEQRASIARASGTRIKELRNGDAWVILGNKNTVASLSEDETVLRVEDDIVVETLADEQAKGGKGGNRPEKTDPVQLLPWGVDKIDAEEVWALGEVGAGINIGVIDTGITSSHPDVSDNVKGGVSEVWYTSSWNDDNGHGSHVAGTIGAVDNTEGVVGGAHGANIYAIKVLDRKGSGYLSDVINGIDWAIINGMDVINLSLGTDQDVQSLYDAVARAYDAGIVVVAAAGNSGGDVSYPAAYTEAIAVAAVDQSGTAPYWSSQGPEVDLAAPGVSIYSTYKGARYATLSGTSMAAPHVASSAALVLHTALDTAFDAFENCVSVYDTNCDGTWNPIEVQHKLQDTAVDLGVPGEDEVYGYGLVNVFDAFN